MRRHLRFLFCLVFTFCVLPWIAISCVIQFLQKTFWILKQVDGAAQDTVLHFVYEPIAERINPSVRHTAKEAKK